MPKIMVSGRGGSGKSTLVTLLAQVLGERGKVLVVDADESNLSLGDMLGQEAPAASLMDYLGGKPAVREKLLASLQQGRGESVSWGIPNPDFFMEDLSLGNLPRECVGGDGPVGYLRIGKIEHSLEGCACPMGAVARSFLKQLAVNKDEWVIVDTEAGVEHFGRGVLEGVDAVVMVVDPSREALLLAGKVKMLTAEAKKDFLAVLNKVDAETEPFLRQELAAQGIPVGGAFGFSPEIMKANLAGKPMAAENWRGKTNELLASLSFKDEESFCDLV